MSALFTLPRAISVPGAKLTFTQTLTTTPQNTYQDNARLTPHANPVVADAAGVFAPIYLDPTLPDYRVKLTTSANVLIYQEDGVPSNQNTQQSMRLESTNPNLFFYDTDGTANKRKYRMRAAGSTFDLALSNDAETVFTSIFSYDATGSVLSLGAAPGNIVFDGNNIATTQVGSFTGTLTGVTGTVTGTISYVVTGAHVTLTSNSVITGTSNSTSMSMTGLPSICASNSGARQICCGLTNSGNTNLLGLATVVSSSVSFELLRTDTVANFVQSALFTNSGTKGIGAWSITYPR